MPRTKVSAADKIEDIAFKVGGDFRPNYSGRFMYGKECVGIVTNLPETAERLAAKRGIRGAVMDSMGRSTIVYWPSVATPTPAED